MEFGQDQDVQIEMAAELILSVALMAVDMPPAGGLNALKAAGTLGRSAKGLETGFAAANMARELSGTARAVGTGMRAAPANVRNITGGGKPLYRYMAKAELDEILDQKRQFLMGSRAGSKPTYWTDARMRNQLKTAERLGLEKPPDYRVQFQIKGSPKIEGGTRVEPIEYSSGVTRTGLGREYWSFDPIEVEIIDAQPMVRP